MKKHEPIHLSGSELQRTREAVGVAMKNLKHVADAVLEKLGRGKLPLGRKGIATIVIKPRNDKIILVDDDGHCVGVYEDPPGVCRPCNADEPGGGFPSNPTE